MGKPNASGMARKPRIIRCAIYTRKSTEEGLEQEFNSLDAQREACAAYVLSQRHEGWILLPEFYDDGGYSGGNMERPGLRRLLAAVGAGKIDVIVVYKVDRLTRALSDFARIVETLDAAGASFVSITQAFNTTTSMGRLTLNVLLSFAQFEREVISERVRDKIAASKQKGMWMGGAVPLGYDVIDRKLVPNTAEAETVRHIFRRYLEVRSVRELMEVLKAEGIRTKLQVRKDGATRGGIPFMRGPLYCLLKNPIYIGQIPHRKATYPGQHEPIVPLEQWNAVQALLAHNGAERKFGTNAAEASLLAGMIKDGEGRSLTPSHASKKHQHYRYYVSSSAEECRASKPTRVPAGEIEKLVTEGVAQHLSDKNKLLDALQNAPLDAHGRDHLLHSWLALGARIPIMPRSELRELMMGIQLEVVVGANRCAATFDPECLRQRSERGEEAVSAALEHRVTIALPGALVRRGQELRLVYTSNGQACDGRRDPRLISLLAKGFAARTELLCQPASGNGSQAQIRRAHLSRVARASYLAPDIIEAVLSGRQPAQLTGRTILRAANIALDWYEQRRLFGFG
jgi:DNA invertase Pin-like site-specific DNA recombinase